METAGISAIWYTWMRISESERIDLQPEIYQGYPFGAGEIGHCTIDIDSPRAIAAIMAAWKRSPPASPSSAGSEKSGAGASSLKSSFDGNDHGLDVTDVITAGLEGDQLAPTC